MTLTQTPHKERKITSERDSQCLLVLPPILPTSPFLQENSNGKFQKFKPPSCFSKEGTFQLCYMIDWVLNTPLKILPGFSSQFLNNMTRFFLQALSSTAFFHQIFSFFYCLLSSKCISDTFSNCRGIASISLINNSSFSKKIFKKMKRLIFISQFTN